MQKDCSIARMLGCSIAGEIHPAEQLYPYLKKDW